MTAFFGKRILKPTWEYTSNALIWRIFFASQEKIIGESRSQDTKTTSFFCLSTQTGIPFWKDVTFGDPWWIGIEQVWQNYLVLHGFTQPDMPEHKGMQIVDIPSGKMVWRNDNLVFWFLKDDRLYAFKYLFEKRVGYELDLLSGEIIREYSGDLSELHEWSKQSAIEMEEHGSHIITPQVYDTAYAEYEIAASIDSITHGTALSDWIEYYLLKGILIMTYYQKVDTLLENILVIQDTIDQKVMYETVLARNLQIPSPDTFFIQNGMVFFIRNGTTLTALKPWNS